MNQEQRIYWNKRFEADNHIWGFNPSNSCVLAEKYFRKDDLKKILVGGCGYGMHTEYFATKGYTTSGLDISDMAIDNARKSASMKDLEGYFSIIEILDIDEPEEHGGLKHIHKQVAAYCKV